MIDIGFKIETCIYIFHEKSKYEHELSKVIAVGVKLYISATVNFRVLKQSIVIAVDNY